MALGRFGLVPLGKVALGGRGPQSTTRLSREEEPSRMPRTQAEDALPAQRQLPERAPALALSKLPF